MSTPVDAMAQLIGWYAETTVWAWKSAAEYQPRDLARTGVVFLFSSGSVGDLLDLPRVMEELVMGGEAKTIFGQSQLVRS